MKTNCSPDVQLARQKLAVLGPLFDALGVGSVALIGSRADSAAGETSDWDFCVEFTRAISAAEYFQLKRALKATFETWVDLCSPQYSEVDFIDLIRPLCVPVYP